MNKCIDCSKKTINYNATRCRKCYLKFLEGKRLHCIDCSKVLKRGKRDAKRCLDCFNKFRKREYLCVDCGKKISRRNGRRCRDCFNKTDRWKGKNNPRWNGGKTISQGYTVISLGNGKRQFEHRLIMEKKLGRKLKSIEIVHHLNGIRSDNRIGNLVITSRKQHRNNTLRKLLQKRIRELENIVAKIIA